MGKYTLPGFTFGPFFLDTAGRRLLRDGKRVRLAPLEVKLLEALLRNRGRVLTNDELRKLVWAEDPNQPEPPAQEKNALYISVGKLRKALKEYGRWVVNVPKTGYFFSEDAPVEETGGSAVNLPHPLTSFVGREEEVSGIEDMLVKTRLLTLTGPPGIGKTRLAMRVANAVAGGYGDGVHLVDFVPISEDVLVPKAVASALGVPEKPDRPMTDTLKDFLRQKHSLLILDNCEHVIEACAALAEDLLRACGGLKVMTTSREALNVIGEAVWVVPPLAIPESGPAGDADDVTRSEAVELFVERARLRDPRFRLGGRNVSAVAELCRRLEGIPLAVELAAARAGELPPERILSLVTEQFEALRVRGDRTQSRHQTLEDAIDWSYELLSAEERLMLRRLSIFVGGWSLEAAEGVCAGGAIEREDVPGLLTRLVRKSLVVMGEKGGWPRYHMLEVLRQYSRARLRESDEEPRMLSSHSDWFIHLAEVAQAAATESERGEGLRRLQTEHDNLRAVLKRTISEGGDVESGLRLCGALRRFWLTRGHISEARRWTERALELDNRASKASRARALQSAASFIGQFPTSEDDPQRGRAFFEESLALWRELGDEVETARTLTDFSYLLDRQGDFDAAEEAARESLNIFAELDHPIGVASASHNWALAVLDRGEYARAVPLFERSLTTSRKTGDKLLPAICLHNLGEIALHQGDLGEASRRLEESLQLSRELGHMPLSARNEVLLGEVALKAGEHSKAFTLQRGALKTLGEIGDTQGIAYALEALACTEATAGNVRRAFQLYGGATALRRDSKLTRGPFQQAFIDSCLEGAVPMLSEEEAENALAEGLEMGLDEVTELAGEDAGL
jgi:predicted ATPase/DNA-binding winged helix-turn-helix (wHTH) protein